MVVTLPDTPAEELGDPASKASAKKQHRSRVGLSTRRQGADLLSKNDVRQSLAVVSGAFPSARPSRGALKQIYNFLLECVEK